MKKLLQITIAIALLVILYFQYRKYRRFNPPQGYDYPAVTGLDTDYYDLKTLQQYYENVYGIGTFARSQWFNHGRDVKFPEEDEEAIRAAQHYNQLIAVTKTIEAKLQRSQALKDKGFGNKDIKLIFEEGLSVEEYELRDYEYLIGLQLGDVGPKVSFIQTRLVRLGHDITVDGKFLTDSEKALKDFQEKSGLFVSGIVDKKTLYALLKKTKG